MTTQLRSGAIITRLRGSPGFPRPKALPQLSGHRTRIW